MPLASRRKTTRLALVSLAALGLDVSVDGARDPVVRAAGFVLVARPVRCRGPSAR
jgi:hypothetical protein